MSKTPPPTPEQMDRIFKAANQALDAVQDMPLNGLFSLCCVVMTVGATRIAKRAGGSWQAQIAAMGLSSLKNGPLETPKDVSPQ